ncbi:MAG: sugar transferase [Lentisphaerae bacterium]|nr:sugar transferase [Lentisphaerota bacterium]
MNYTVQRVLAAILLVMLLPLMTGIYLVLFITLRNNAIFGGIRLGWHKKEFTIWKFTTMRRWRPRRFKQYLDNNPEAMQEWKSSHKLENDPRLLKIGRIMRRFSMDELPQLWNVVTGEMALIGPRPIVEEENKRYGKYSTQLHSVKPGITGLWQVSGRNLLSYHRRIAINLYYVKNRSLKLDLWIIYKTFAAVLGGRGAY